MEEKSLPFSRNSRKAMTVHVTSYGLPDDSNNSVLQSSQSAARPRSMDLDRIIGDEIDESMAAPHADFESKPASKTSQTAPAPFLAPDPSHQIADKPRSRPAWDDGLTRAISFDLSTSI